jgi:hypothetical protein
MAGLLDFDATDPSQYMVSDEERRRLILSNVLLQMAPALAGSRKGQLLNGAAFGLANGAMAAQGALGAAQQGKFDKLKMASGIMDYQQKKSAYDDDRRASELERNYQPQAPADAPQGAAPASNPRPGMYEQLLAKADAFANAGLGKKAKEYRDEALKYRPKFSQTPQVGMDPQTGQPFNYVLDEQGNMQRLDGAGVAPKFREINTNDKVQLVNEYNVPAGGQSFAAGMNPYQKESLALDRSKFGYQQQRDKAQDAKGPGEAKPQWDPTTGQFVFAPSPDAPSGRAVKPEGYVAKPPEHTRKELDSIDAQLGIVAGARKAAADTPSAFSMKRGAATMAGAMTESVAGRFDSPKEREARSYVYNVVSKVINERAGAAQSVQELSRLRSFLPAEMDDSKQIQDKLKAFETYLHDSRKAYAGAGKPKTVNFADLPQ